MDNIKMGALIREARKKKGLTQKDIAIQLNITDRAVSKWERGICAPDLALLEPLADILGITITELITGEQENFDGNKEKLELVVKETIQYSKQEKTNTKKKIIWFIFLCIFLIFIILGTLWYNGCFHIIGKYTSPDGSVTTTVYNCLLGYNTLPTDNGITFSNEGRFEGRSLYQNCEFIGLWWSPDSNYKVVSLYSTKYDEHWFVLTDFKRNVATDLFDRLEEAIYESEFFPKEISNLSFEFIQWSEIDPAVMLIYFNYEDSDGNFHEGYMWYDYESGLLSGEMEIDQSKKEIYFLNEFWDNAN